MRRPVDELVHGRRLGLVATVARGGGSGHAIANALKEHHERAPVKAEVVCDDNQYLFATAGQADKVRPGEAHAAVDADRELPRGKTLDVVCAVALQDLQVLAGDRHAVVALVAQGVDIDAHLEERLRGGHFGNCPPEPGDVECRHGRVGGEDAGERDEGGLGEPLLLRGGERAA
jgi:hypothetical protein